MISSVQNASSTLNGFGRALNPGARAAANPEVDEAGVARAVEKVDSEGSVGVELSQRDMAQITADPTENTRTRALDDQLDQKAADMIVQKAAARAGIAVIRTADRMVGSLLDVFG